MKHTKKVILITVLSAMFSLCGINAKASTVGLWLFDEGIGNIASDSSAYNNDGTIYGATWSSDTPFSYTGDHALSFDGIDDYIQISNSSSLNLTNAFTFEAWIKLESTGFRYIGDKYHIYGLKIQDYIRRPLGFIKVGGSTYEVMSSEQIALNTWVHLATTYDGDALKIYVNGELRGTNSSPSGPINSYNSGDLFIGRYGGGGYNFNGLIDEVRISDEALSSSQLGYDNSLMIPEPASLYLFAIGLIGLLRSYKGRKLI